MCVLTTASNYAIGAKGRYLYLWVLAGSGYLWVAGNPYEMRGGVWVVRGELRRGAGSHNPEKGHL